MEHKRIICTFDKAQYIAGQPVQVRLPQDARPESVQVFRLAALQPCRWEVCDDLLTLQPLPPGAYGLRLCFPQGEIWEGAFDVVSDHREVTRYGFLADFSSRESGEEDVAWLRDLHINAVQYYDWMYRHDRLLAPESPYQDPMGRQTDLEVIARKLRTCKEMGMRSLAYGAVYAATPETYAAHPDWAMYTLSGKPMTFADWLYYMDVSHGSGWCDHIVEEFRSAVAYGFNGIHMDTYGFPKHVWDHRGQPVDLSQELPLLIGRCAQAVRNQDADSGVIFNAVNNWPVDTVATTSQDAVYIEVWPPHDTYFDLYTLIREAKLRGGRQVVLAAYLKSFRGPDLAGAQRSFRLAWAAICASGGTQLVLGEYHGLLQDSYYVHYAHLRPGFVHTVQRYCDFLVRYSDLLYNDTGMDITKTASGGINEDVCFTSPDCCFSTDAQGGSVWTILRESSGRLTVQLINLLGNDNHWNRPKAESRPASGIQIRLRLDRDVTGAYFASPDAPSLQAVGLPCRWEDSAQGRIYTVDVPDVAYWAVVWLEWEG